MFQKLELKDKFILVKQSLKSMLSLIYTFFMNILKITHILCYDFSAEP